MFFEAKCSSPQDTPLPHLFVLCNSLFTQDRIQAYPLCIDIRSIDLNCKFCLHCSRSRFCTDQLIHYLEITVTTLSKKHVF